MARRPRLSLSEYSHHLPSGIILKYSASSKTFTLINDGYDLAIRHEEVVRQWKHPSQVFGYIARSTLHIRKGEKEDKRAKEK